MALTALAGIASLSGLITTASGTLITFLASRIAKRIAVITVIIGAFYALLSVVLNAVATYAIDLISGLPPEVASLAIALPSNTGACISAIISVEVACMTYKLGLKLLDYQSRVV